MKRYIFFFINILLFSVQHAVGQVDESSIQCEDTCRHVHGIDLSHYQGDVFGKQSVKTVRWHTYI